MALTVTSSSSSTTNSKGSLFVLFVFVFFFFFILFCFCFCFYLFIFKFEWNCCFFKDVWLFCIVLLCGNQHGCMFDFQPNTITHSHHPLLLFLVSSYAACPLPLLPSKLGLGFILSKRYVSFFFFLIKFNVNRIKELTIQKKNKKIEK